MDRREFLKAFAATTAFSVLNPLEAVSAEPKNRPLRVGFIGTGSRGTAVITAMSRNNNVEIYALADLFRDRIDKVLPHLNSLNKAKGMDPVAEENIYTGGKAYKKLLKNNKVDLVIISTPA